MRQYTTRIRPNPGRRRRRRPGRPPLLDAATPTPPLAELIAAAATMVVVSRPAYDVLIAHACRHATRAVVGVLVGRVRAASDPVASVEGAFPIAHSPITKALLAIALDMIHRHCEALGPDYAIVGAYEANELCDDRSIGDNAIAIGKAIADGGVCSKPIVAMVDNEAIGHLGEQGAVRLSLCSGAGLTLQLGDPVETLAGVREGIAARQYDRVVDFEEHLADVGRDWRNPTFAMRSGN